MPATPPGTGHRPAPEDRCPYHRPFGPGFADCPAYQPRATAAMTSAGDPIGSVLSCAHLTSGEHPGGGFYARCGLGTPADREMWAQRVSPNRAQLLRTVREELNRRMEPLLPELADVGERSRRAPADQALAESRRELAHRIMEVLEGVVVAYRDRWQDLGMDVDSVRRLLDTRIRSWVLDPSAPTPPLDPSLSAAARMLLAPAAMTGLASEAEPLRLLGTLNADAVERIRDILAQPGDGNVVLELSGVAHADRAGVSALALIALRLPAGRHLVLRAPSPRVVAQLRLAGLSRAPGLVVEWPDDR